MAGERKDNAAKGASSATPQAGDLRALGPLGRPMTRDELVDGPDPKLSRGSQGKPVAGDVQAEGPLGRPMTRDELVDGKSGKKP